jgi:hypothetical protein
MQPMAERPCLLPLRRKAGLTSEQVTKEAGLTLAEEYRAEIGGAVAPDAAERLLAAFSRLTGKAWTLKEAAIHSQQRGM